MNQTGPVKPVVVPETGQNPPPRKTSTTSKPAQQEGEKPCGQQHDEPSDQDKVDKVAGEWYDEVVQSYRVSEEAEESAVVESAWEAFGELGMKLDSDEEWMEHLDAALSPGAKGETLSSDNRRKGRLCQTYFRLRNWWEK